MLTYTYVSEGKFELMEKPKPVLQHERDAIVKVTLASICSSEMCIRDRNGNALIGAALIFTGDVEKDVVPTAAPVRRQALPYPLRPFGEQKKHHIAALAHDVPRLSPPRVGFFQEEIRGHADPDLLTTLDFVVSGAVFLERVGKAAFRFVDLGPVLVPHPRCV